MSSAADPYRDGWRICNGVLSPSERQEYEQHLTACQACSTDVTELAGISGMLSAVPADQAIAILAWVAAGLAVAAAAMLVFAPSIGAIGSSTDDGRLLTMAQTQPGPITAQARIIEESWGTTIELECSYATFFGGELLVEPWDYALVVIDTSGGQTQQATWEAAPGGTVTPTATTAMTIDEIERIEIRAVDSGRVLLTFHPGNKAAALLT